ncbi:MAG: hypothetical protein MJZ30_12445 [Paludibacteraceae bacterium]|nr:hypothetical protein [Paludibacteraceae bacterium]
MKANFKSHKMLTNNKEDIMLTNNKEDISVININKDNPWGITNIPKNCGDWCFYFPSCIQDNDLVPDCTNEDCDMGTEK